jgi:predicted nucleic acid-binding protein
VADDGGLVRVEASLIAHATTIAEEHGISVYDAAYVAAARASNGQLVSCDVRELVSRGLARLPGDAVSSQKDAE